MIKDSIYTLLTRIFFILGKIVYSILINRTLGPVGKGAFELIASIPDMLARFGSFGFDEAHTYFTGREPKTIPRLISNTYGLTVRFAVVALILGAAFFLIPGNRILFTEVPFWIGFLALSVIPVIILDMLLEGILYGENRIWVRNWHEIIRILAMLFYMGIFVVGFGWGVQGAIYGYILINITLFVFIYLCLIRFHKPGGGGEDKALARRSFHFGRFLWGANFATYLFYNIDRWLIYWLVRVPDEYINEKLRSMYFSGQIPFRLLAGGNVDEQKFSGFYNNFFDAQMANFDIVEKIRNSFILEQVGLYGTAVSIIVTIWIIPDAIQTALRPKITQKGEPERKKLVPPSLRAVTFLVFISMVALALIAKPALHILYNRPDAAWDFREAYAPLMLLMPGIFTLSLAKMFATDLFSRGKPQYALWISIMSLVLNISFNLYMIPRWGMNGAAIASSLSYTFSFLAFLYFYVKESGEKSRDIFLPKKSDFQLVLTYLRAIWDKSAMNSTGDEGDEG